MYNGEDQQASGWSAVPGTVQQPFQGSAGQAANQLLAQSRMGTDSLASNTLQPHMDNTVPVGHMLDPQQHSANEAVREQQQLLQEQQQLLQQQVPASANSGSQPAQMPTVQGSQIAVTQQLQQQPGVPNGSQAQLLQQQQQIQQQQLQTFAKHQQQLLYQQQQQKMAVPQQGTCGLPPLPPSALQYTRSMDKQSQGLHQPLVQWSSPVAAAAKGSSDPAAATEPGHTAATLMAAADGAASAATGNRQSDAHMAHVLADNGVLDLGCGVSFKIPLWYDDLAKTGAVPRLEEIALPADLLRQPLAQPSTAALVEAAQARSLLRGRWQAAAKTFLATLPSEGQRQQWTKLNAATNAAAAAATAAEQARQQLAALAAASVAPSAAQSAVAAAAAAATTANAAAVAAALAVCARQLQPANAYDTTGRLHWSVVQHQQLLHQQYQEEAEQAAAGFGSKKRNAAAAGMFAGPAAKKLAAELAAGGPDGQQWWYVPGAEQQGGRHKGPRHLDPAAQAAYEEAGRAKAWAHLVRRDVPRAARLAAARRGGVVSEAGRLAEACSRELRLRAAKAAREAGRGAGASLRRLLREGQAWWRTAGREALGANRAAARAAADAARKADEEREARRQQQRLNFLLTQTELYSHFMKNKMHVTPSKAAPPSTPVKPAAGGGAGDVASPGSLAAAGFGSPAAAPAPATTVGWVGSPSVSQTPQGLGFCQGFGGGGFGLRFKPSDLADDEAEAKRLATTAAARAQQAAASTLHAAASFDQEYAAGAAAVGATPDHMLHKQPQRPGQALDSAQQGTSNGQVDLTKPSTMPEASSVLQPSGFRGTLKGYQLKGLQWLASLYDQGLNGILADEMGLGKTVQALAFLCHLAESRGVWGPFLIVAPASTLHNWDKELSTFTPGFKVLPYWGGLADRKTLRRLLTPSRLYGRAAPFHVALTSYQIAVADEAVLKKVKWQYMVLDEAQAIKSSGSARWRALLSFGCRNRLLLSGTPIQNNLQELWALLHFIMPQLFDSRDAFNEWFARGASTGAAGGSSGTGGAAPQMLLDRHQLARLHGVLGPFMLRRVKADVVAEMAPKTEVILRCRLSRRQAQLYAALRKNLTLQDLVAFKATAAAAASGGSRPAGAGMSRLMGLIMQMRKVCNHPELFEGQEERWPLTFAALTTPLDTADTAPVARGPGRPPVITTIPGLIQITGFRSHLQVSLPKLLYNEGLAGLSSAVLGGHLEGARQLWLRQRMQLFIAANLYQLQQGLQVLQQQSQQLLASDQQMHIKQQQVQQEQQQEAQQQQHSSAANGFSSRYSSTAGRGSGQRAVLSWRSEPYFNTGCSFVALCGSSPSEAESAAAGDPWQRWELAYAARRNLEAAYAWQQRWQDYDITEQQWWQQRASLLQQQQQQQQQPPVAEGGEQLLLLKDHSKGTNQQHNISSTEFSNSNSQPIKLGMHDALLVNQQHHSDAEQQLLLLPPTCTALANGRALRHRRLLLVIDDLSAGSSSSKCFLQEHRAVLNADARQLLQKQQQEQDDSLSAAGTGAAAAAIEGLLGSGTAHPAGTTGVNHAADTAAAGVAHQHTLRELGQLLPPLVWTARRRLWQLSPLLRAVWGALIPPVLSPPGGLAGSNAGLRGQLKTLSAAPWSRAMLLGINSHPTPPTFPAGAPPLLVAAATWRVASAAALLQAPPRQPLLLPELTPAAAVESLEGESSALEDEGTPAGQDESGADDSGLDVLGSLRGGLGHGQGSSTQLQRPKTADGNSRPPGMPPLPPGTVARGGRGGRRGRRGRGGGRWGKGRGPKQSPTPAASDATAIGNQTAPIAALRPHSYRYVVSRQQAALPGFCRDVPAPAPVPGNTAEAMTGAANSQQQQQQIVQQLQPQQEQQSAQPQQQRPVDAHAQQQQPEQGMSLRQPQPQQQQSFPLVVQTRLPPQAAAQLPPAPLLRLLPWQPLMSPLLDLFGSAPPSQQYSVAKALADSGKLMALDGLLGKLKIEGHRVLVFCQMTTMMDLLEECFAFRRHRWLRLDGSTPIPERRDLVDAWQGSDAYFIFLLSTRAGGLGINLTAADTVIFYESDWNPTMDAQAMDRCHRLGQTRPVTVYRLITAGTIEERIQSTAAAKTHVQRLVMAGDQAAAAEAAGAATGGDMDAANAAAAAAERTKNHDEYADEDIGDEALLVPGSVPDGMLLDELEDEEAAGLDVSNTSPGAGIADGPNTSGAGGIIFDDTPAMLGAADVASLLMDEDLAQEAAGQGVNLSDFDNDMTNSQQPSRNASPGVSGLSGFGTQTPPHTAAAGFGMQGGFGSQGAAVGFAGSSSYQPSAGLAAVAPGSSSPAPRAGAVGGLSFKKRGGGRPPGPGRGITFADNAAAAGVDGVGRGRGRGRGRRGRPPASGKQKPEGARARGRGRGRKKKGDQAVADGAADGFAGIDSGWGAYGQ